MNIFKHIHPKDLISRLFILEYMREIGAEELHAKANKYQREKMFYLFTTENEEGVENLVENIDINYEYCTFIATLYELENLMEKFLPEIAEVEEKRKKIYEAVAEQTIAERLAEPVDINVMDMAQTEINKSKDVGIIFD